jgi:hypothetical protein
MRAPFFINILLVLTVVVSTPESPQADEPKGIDIWDLDSEIAPGIRGQIHVIMIDNYGREHKDDLYFKHYTTASGNICKI